MAIIHNVYVWVFLVSNLVSVTIIAESLSGRVMIMGVALG